MSKSVTTKVERFDSAALSKPEKEARPLNRCWKVLAPIGVGIGLLFLPTAEGLTPNAWYYFALFGGAARHRRAVPAVLSRLKYIVLITTAGPPTGNFRCCRCSPVYS